MKDSLERRNKAQLETAKQFTLDQLKSLKNPKSLMEALEQERHMAHLSDIESELRKLQEDDDENNNR